MRFSAALKIVIFGGFYCVMGRFFETSACLWGNDVSFWKSDVLFLFERRVVLLVVKHLGWRGKKRGAKCKLWHLWQQKSKTLVGCARVYTRGKDTYSIFVFDTVLSELKDGSPLASCKANKTTKSCLFDVVLQTMFFRIEIACSENFTFSSFFPSLVQYLPIYL